MVLDSYWKELGMVRILSVSLCAFLLILVALPAGHAYVATHGKITTYARGAGYPPGGCPPAYGAAPMMMGPYPPMGMHAAYPRPITKCKPPMMA